MRAQRLDNRDPAIDYGPGRACEDCGQPLSRYNSDRYCRTHERPSSARDYKDTRRAREGRRWAAKARQAS